MDSIISLGQKNPLAEYMILSGADNRPPMLDKDLTKKYAELSAAEKIQADCDMKATNIILQGLHADIYSLERKYKLYDAFDKFTHIKGELLHTYYLRFTQLINDMNIYKMKIEQFQVHTKFLNSLPPEWIKFVTDVKLVKDLHTSNFDQLHAYLKQYELHANEVRIMRERNQDPLAFERQGKNYSGTTYKGNATISRGNTTSGQARVVKCYNCQGEGHMVKQCSQPKRPRNVAWYKEKAMLAEAQEAGQILDEEQLAFLKNIGIPTGQAQKIIPRNAAFQTKDLDTYDSDCDDLSTAQAVLMAYPFH
ncbi:retrovirus-related pol polyprotein from transposon TNT 1-94 [Tanacetum coccineum]